MIGCGTFHNSIEYVCITVILFKQEVAERRLCMLGGGEDDTGLEFDEEFVTGSEMQRFQRQVTSGGKCSSRKEQRAGPQTSCLLLFSCLHCSQSEKRSVVRCRECGPRSAWTVGEG